MRTGVITQKVGMTRLFLDDGRHVPVTVLKLDGCQVVWHAHGRKGRLQRRAAGFGLCQGQAPDEGRSRQFREGRSRAQEEARRIPRRCEEPARSRRFHPGRSFRAGPEGRRHRRHHRPRFHRRHEALEFPRSRSVARRVDLAPLARRHRRPSGSGQDLQEQEDARPLRRRQRHHAESRSRQGRCRARPDHDPRRGARIEGRLGHGARCRQASAQGCPDARFGQEARSGSSAAAKAEG